MLRDLLYGVRSAAKAPGTTAWIVGSLGIGIGVTTAAFSIFYSVVLRPLKFPDSDRLVRICETREAADSPCFVSPPDARDWARQSESFEAIATARLDGFVRQDAAGAEPVVGASTTAELFDVLGIEPLIGRLIDRRAVEERQPVAVLSYPFWKTRYSGDPGVLGKALVLDGRAYEIIGVLYPGEQIPRLSDAELFVPLPLQYLAEEYRSWRGFVAIGRLAPLRTLDEARSELGTVAARLAALHPDTNKGWGVALAPLKESLVGNTRTSLVVFFLGGAFVLLIACANVANLLLSRAVGRRHEVATRLALGASRREIVRLFLSESLVYAVIGGAVGLAGSWLALKVFVALAPRKIPRLEEIAIDSTVLVFCASLTLVTILLFGLGPALRMSSSLRTTDLGGAGRTITGGRSNRARSVLVIAEVGLAFLLLVGGALLLQSYLKASTWQPGFNSDDLVIFHVLASEDKYEEDSQVAGYYQDLLTEVRAVPGVVSASLTTAGPLFGGEEALEFFSEEGLLTKPYSIRFVEIGPGYFSTLGLPMLHGRPFTRQDRAGSPPVAIVNATMASRFWPGGDAIGKRVGWGREEMREIVGVVADVQPSWPATVAEPEIYWPMLQDVRWGTFVVVRTAPGVVGLTDVIRTRLRERDLDSSIGPPILLSESLSTRLVRPRFNAMLLAGLASVALALALGGAYGVTSSMVAHRTHEIGLRMVLGARRATILRWVVMRGLFLTLAGVGLGLLGSLLMTRGLESMLYEIKRLDPLAFLAAAFLLLSVTWLACYLPARRAARISPMNALRGEAGWARGSSPHPGRQ